MQKKKVKRLLSIFLCVLVAFTLTPMIAAGEDGGGEFTTMAGDIKLDPAIEYQTMDGWGTSICWWGNTVGTWIGATNEKSIAYGLSLDPPVSGMTVRDAIIHMMFSPEGLNMNMARFCVGGGDQNEYASTTIRRIEAMVPGWSIDIYGDSNSNNSGQIVAGFFDKPIRQMNDYGQLYVLQQAARIRQEACAAQGKPNDFVVEVFSNSPPWYMTESGKVTGAYGVNMTNAETWPYSGPNATGNADNLVKDQDMTNFAAYMAAAAKYMDNMLAPYGAGVDMVNPFNEPGTRYWGCDHGGNMYKQEGCNVSMGEPQDKMLRKMRTALDGIGMQDTFLTMGETDFGNTINGYNQFAQDVKDMIPLVGTHAYDNESAKVKGSNDINRVYLRDLMKSHDKTLWQAELGQGNGSFITGQMNGARALSKSINRDLKTMQAAAWMDWNPLEPLYDSLSVNTQGTTWSLGGWGLMAVNSNSTAYGVEGTPRVAMFGKAAGPFPGQSQSSLFSGGIPKWDLLDSAGWGDYAYKEGKSYYAHMQYSKFIKQGYTQVDIGHDYMVAFVSPDQKELVVVAYTTNSTSGLGNNNASVANINALNTTVDLSAFPGATTAKVYRTTAGTSATAWGDSCVARPDQDVSGGVLNVSLSSDQIYTYVIKNDADEPIYTKNRSYEIVNSEVVYKEGSSYSQIDKFQYSGSGVWAETTWHELFPTDPFTLKYFSWENTYRPTYYTMPTTTIIQNNPSYNAYDHSVRRATADGASATFRFDGNSASIWGLLKSTADAATFSVELDGEVVAENLTNEGTAGANARLFDTGILFSDGPHTLTITKIGAGGTLDIGNAKIGNEVSPLYALAKTCDAVDAAYYTGTSYANLASALVDAKTLMSDAAAAEGDYAGIQADLSAAFLALVESDSDALQDAYDEISAALDGLREDYYKASTWNALQDALSEAGDLLANPDAEQDEIDAVLEVLLAAYDALIINPVIALLISAVEDADAIVGAPGYAADYPLAKRTALEAALTTAKSVLANPENFTDTGKTSAWNSLRNAITALQEPVNTPKTELAWWINYAEEILAAPAAANYIPAAKENLQDAIDAAKLVYANALSTDVQFAAEVEKIQEAIWQIYEKGDKTELQQFYDLVKDYNENLYTADSWAEFKDALDAAKDTIDDVNAIEYDVVKAYQDLIAGEAQLALKTVVDFTALNAAIAAGQKILDNKADYVASSIVGLQGLVTNARALLIQPGVTQAEVNTAANALRQAIAKARLKPDRSPLLSSLALAQGLSLSSFTTASTEPLAALVAQGNALAALPDEALTQAQINALAQQIRDAVAALVLVLDPSQTPDPAQPGAGSAGSGGVSALDGMDANNVLVLDGSGAGSGSGSNAAGNSSNDALNGPEASTGIGGASVPLSTADGQNSANSAMIAAVVALSALLALAVCTIIFLLWKRRKEAAAQNV